MYKLIFFLFLFVSFSIKAQTQDSTKKESHLKNITQLTFGGDNAEAYFSFDGKFLSFQSNNPAWGLKCDQIYSMNIKRAKKETDKYKPNLISTGKGRTTCSYYLPGDKKILFASVHHYIDSCPTLVIPDIAKNKYLWGINPEYDIFVSDLKGQIVQQLTDSFGYDAEATVSSKGDKIVFTSTRSGDLELWIMNIDGSGLKQITTGLGYDGGAFFSPDGTKIVFRSSRPQTEAEIKEYKELLALGLVAPTNMEIYVCDTNGQNLKQITHLGKANWAPYFHPSGNKIIFSSNYASTRGYAFQLYMINLDGTGLTQITTESNFNAFPMFSPDGKKLVFSSNRNNGGTRDTNLFIADWIE
ncbi:MAG: PD40 domain-containing protein [Bacteroidia bacterium]|nr:PD40 domain-containing protein [Bacteroidia bacterium]